MYNKELARINCRKLGMKSKSMGLYGNPNNDTKWCKWGCWIKILMILSWIVILGGMVTYLLFYLLYGYRNFRLPEDNMISPDERNFVQIS